MKQIQRVGLMTGLALGIISSAAAGQGNPPPSAPPQQGQMPPMRGRGMRGMGPMNGPMPGRGRMAGPGRGLTMVPAGRVLAAKEELSLTDDQVKRLEALRTSQREALRPPTPARLRAMADLAEAREKDNIDGERSALEKLARLRVDEQVAYLRAAKEARDVLTPDQREKVGGMLRRMPGGPGMRGRGPGEDLGDADPLIDSPPPISPRQRPRA